MGISDSKLFSFQKQLWFKNNWPIRILAIILIFELSSIFSMTINQPHQVDTVIKSKISRLINIENLENVQSVQTQLIGPVTFYKYNFFSQNNRQVSAKATQILGFSPQITCVSSSKSYRCQ